MTGMIKMLEREGLGYCNNVDAGVIGYRGKMYSCCVKSFQVDNKESGESQTLSPRSKFVHTSHLASHDRSTSAEN